MQAFQTSGHQWAAIEINGEVARTIRAITASHTDPTASQSFNRNTRNSASADSAPFPNEWVVDRTRLRAAITRFHQNTVSYRRAFLPIIPEDPPSFNDSSPSIGDTPFRRDSHPSASRLKSRFLTEVDDSPILGRNRRDDITGSTSESRIIRQPTTETGETSAEEAIYDSFIDSSNRPLGWSEGEAMTEFTEAQERVIDAIVARAVAAVRQGPQGTPGPQGDPGPPGPFGAEGNGGSSWRPEDLGFFDPHLPTSYDTGPMIRDGKDVYYRNVHLFIERVLDLASTKGADVVRTNLNTCLRGSALIWYIAELTALERSGLRQIDLKEGWISSLRTRFKPNQSAVISSLVAERYSIVDVRNDREPANYVQQMISYAKDANFDSIYHQIMWAWRNLDAELKRDISTSTEHTTLAQFLRMVENKKEVWQEVYRSRSSHLGQRDREDRNRVGGRTGQYSNNPRDPPIQNARHRGEEFRPRPFYGGYGNYFQNTANPYQSYQPYGNQQGYRSNQANPPLNVPQLSAPPAQRLITGPTQPGQTQQGQRSGYTSKPASGGPTERYQYRTPLQPRSGNDLGKDRRVGVYQEEAYQENGYSDHDALGEDDGTTDPYDYHGHGGDLDDPAVAGQDGGDYQNSTEYVDAGFIGTPRLEQSCRLCKHTFYSKNKLHRHLRADHSNKERIEAQHADPIKKSTTKGSTTKGPTTKVGDPWKQVVTSTAKPDKGDGYDFRNWKYATVKATIAYQAAMSDVCIDTGCTMSLIDRQWLLKLLPTAVIQRTQTSVKVRGIEDREHDSSEYTTIDLYIPGSSNTAGEPSIVQIKREVHIVDHLRARMLIGADILGPEGMVPDLQNRRLLIGSCKMTVPITCIPPKSRVNRNASTFAVTVLPAFAVTPVPFKLKGVSKLLRDRDFSFQPHTISTVDLGAEGGVMAHVLDADIAVVHVRNATDQTVRLPKHTKLGRITDFEEEGCYHLHASDAHLATGASWKKRAFNTAVAGLAVATSCFNSGASQPRVLAKTPVGSPTSIEVGPRFTTALSTASTELTTTEGITIYGTSIAQQRLLATTDAFPTIWKEGGTVNVPESEWMLINIILGAKPDTPKVYPVGSQDREVIDKEFDKLHRNDKLRWITDVTSYDFSMFVVWRTIHTLKNSVRKNRVVINIRGLNKIIVPDDYFMPLQSDIINLVNECSYVSVMNGTSYFHQWSMKVIDRYKLIVMSHRNNEQ